MEDGAPSQIAYALRMVITTANYTDSRYRTFPGDGFDGVVRLSYGGYFATGALLFDGRAILTAAHLFKTTFGSASVTFETRTGMHTLSTNHILQHPGYDTEGNNDLAIVWLSETAPISADRYELYRKGDEIGQVFTFSGYGRTGSGSTGATDTDNSSPLRLKATNRFDADAATLKSFLGSLMAWTPQPQTQLLADFDNGTSTNDALGRLMLLYDTGQGLDEGLIAQGDSGGPLFSRTSWPAWPTTRPV
jgi:secreted trypsin-like serine protease